MLHSTVTGKGQTTIPGKIRKALKINPGDTLTYSVKGDAVTFKVHPGLKALKGALASGKGTGLPFTEIRRKASEAAVRRWKEKT